MVLLNLLKVLLGLSIKLDLGNKKVFFFLDYISGGRMSDLVKDGKGTTTVDFFIEMARRKMDNGSDTAVNVIFDSKNIIGRVVSVGVDVIQVKTASGERRIKVSDILDMN